MNNQNLYALLSQNFVPDKSFLVSSKEETLLSYGDLESCSSQLANMLARKGLVKGDRVLVQVEKSPLAMVLYMACLRAGLIYLPLNNAYTPRELAYFVDNAEPRLVVCDPAQESIFTEICQCQILLLNAEGEGSAAEFQAYSEQFETVLCETDDVAAIIYTSGTTGQPKGAMISHGNLRANVLALDKAWGWRSDDAMLHVLPVFHIHGLFISTHLPMLHASPIVFLPKFDVEDVIRLLPRVTAFMGVPTHYVRLLDNENFSEELCANIRVMTAGSAPMLVHTHQQIKQRTGREIIERYGMTEAGIIASNPIHGPVSVGTVGKPMDGVTLRVVDNAGHECVRGDIGAIQVKGDGIFQGYWRLPEKTAMEFSEDGFFITGDLGSIDGSGNLTISGRNKDLIISGGLNVYPKEIELVIDQVPGVLESAVIGLPHRDFGEAVSAVVVKDQSLAIDEQSLIDSLKDKLANFKIPKSVIFVESLPRNAMGKVQKNRLRQTYNKQIN